MVAQQQQWGEGKAGTSVQRVGSAEGRATHRHDGASTEVGGVLEAASDPSRVAAGDGGRAVAARAALAALPRQKATVSHWMN